jgi:acetyltransferase
MQSSVPQRSAGWHSDSASAILEQRTSNALRCNMTLLRPKPAGRFAAGAMFHPGSVAVIGAGTPLGHRVMTNLRDADFKGAVLPVDHSARAVAGVLAYPSIAALPLSPDLAVIADPAEIEASVPALAEKGCFAAVVLGAAAGLGDLARRTGVRMLGPSSFGLVVPAIGLNASRAHLAAPSGRLAVVSQSAAFCQMALDWAGPSGVGFSYIIGIGGNADLGFSAALDWLSRDPGTSAIVLDVRLIKDRRAFLSAARAAARLRPVVAMRAGARLLDPSGMADLAFEAALRRAGVLCVTHLEDLLAAAETLARARPARGEALSVVTNAISAGRMAADAALREGLQLAPLTAETEMVVRAHLGVPPAIPGLQEGADYPGIADGLIYAGIDMPIRLAEVAALLAGAAEVGGILVVHAPTGPGDDEAIEALAACVATIKTPLLVAALGESTGAARRQRLAEAGVTAFPTPEQAVRGFAHLVQDRRNRAAARELPPSRVITLAADANEVAHLLRRLRACGRRDLSQDQAMTLLSAYGLPTVPTRVVGTPEDAAAAADLLGYPVVVKRRDFVAPADRERGGVVLDLHDVTAVRLAARMLIGRQMREDPAREPALLVQSQAARARELLIRVADDPIFGPTIGFGQGGSAAVVVRDLAMDLPPLNLSLATALIGRTRAASTLGALRGLPAARTEAVAEALVRVSQIIVDFPEIERLEINPLFVDARGVLLGDAWLRLRAAGERTVLAISPYPAELAEHWDAHGERLTIRPIRPEDAAQHAAFFARLSPEDVRFRFFTTMRELSPEMIARLTQIDYDREMAFAAVRESTGETIGVSRLVMESGGQSGEFAVIVQPDAKGKGVATRLMQRIIDWARMRGMHQVAGQVLADNAPMLSFVRHLGFTVRRMADEPDVMDVRLNIEEPVSATVSGPRTGEHMRG